MAGRPWTNSDVAFLRDSIGQTDVAKIAMILDRTENAVLQKAYDLGYTHNDICKSGYYKTQLKYLRDIHKSLYHERIEQGLCTRCGKHWAEAGQRMCNPCRERARKWWRDNDMNQRVNEFRSAKRQERKANGQCRECGAKLLDEERGVYARCRACRAKINERTQVRRMRDRIHGIPRKY